MTLDWTMETTPRAPEAPYGGWRNRDAEETMVALALAGCSVRQVAEMTGFSREWVRRRLKNRGRLSGNRSPTGRVRPGRDGRVPWGYELHAPEQGEPVWGTTIFGIPTHRGVLLELGMFSPHESLAHASGEKRSPTGLPPIAKLMSPEGWHLTPGECVAAMDEWAASGPTPLAEVVARVLGAGGWDTSEAEVDLRTAEFLGLLAALRLGADGDGLTVL